MKAVNLFAIFATAGLSLYCSTHSIAGGTTDTVFNGKVINSTYTFTNVGTSGPSGNFQLDQTTIQNLNSLNPPVTLQLVLTSVTYTEATVVGNGRVPTIQFYMTPTLGNVNYQPNQPNGILITLTSPTIANGVSENNVLFTLSNPSPVVFQAVPESNPSNTNGGTGTWNESLSNLEPNPDSITTSNGNFSPSSVQNQNFSFNGSVEVVYAAPEPSAGMLGLVAVAIFGMLSRRRGLRG